MAPTPYTLFKYYQFFSPLTKISNSGGNCASHLVPLRHEHQEYDDDDDDDDNDDDDDDDSFTDGLTLTVTTTFIAVKLKTSFFLMP